MSELDILREIATYIFTWFSHLDEKACSTCRALNGRDYRDQNLYQNVLFDHWYGDIWDLDADRSLMHGASGTCRCQLTVRVEFDWANWDVLREIHEANVLFKALPGAT